jgi:hypothetical protein
LRFKQEKDLIDQLGCRQSHLIPKHVCSIEGCLLLTPRDGLKRTSQVPSFGGWMNFRNQSAIYISNVFVTDFISVFFASSDPSLSTLATMEFSFGWVCAAIFLLLYADFL